jgi:NAD(P)-dependent dehydrogenase (short-subunit alcohol dehydrogenase family)
VAGIGKATAMELARQGMAVTIACRNKEKGEEAAAEIVRNTNNPSIRVMICDLASLTSVRQFAKEYLDQGLPLNSLVNNAGVMACPQQYTEDGFEYQLGVRLHCHWKSLKIISLFRSWQDSGRPCCFSF